MTKNELLKSNPRVAIWRLIALNLLLVVQLICNEPAVAEDSKTFRCVAKFNGYGNEYFSSIFAIDPDARSIEQLSGDQSLIQEINVDPGEVSFIVMLRHGDSNVRYTINRHTLSVSIQSMNVDILGDYPHYTFNFTEGKGSGSGYCERIKMNAPL